MPTIYRFPGGSGNLVNKNGMDEFIRYLKDKNILYYDWNVVSGDATGEKFTKEQLTQNVLEGVASKKRSIVLMHDAQSKRTTVDSLPELLDALVSQGAELLPLNEDVTPIQQIRAEEVK
jgi:peptidoglycan/xylan/chitin deacetylase (PgdA/CDA1 family)